MKADRKRLKIEKADLVSQMQQLYATLESREDQLREFIRNYDQHRKVTAVCPLIVSLMSIELHTSVQKKPRQCLNNRVLPLTHFLYFFLHFSYKMSPSMVTMYLKFYFRAYGICKRLINGL